MRAFSGARRIPKDVAATVAVHVLKGSSPKSPALGWAPGTTQKAAVSNFDQAGAGFLKTSVRVQPSPPLQMRLMTKQ